MDLRRKTILAVDDAAENLDVVKSVLSPFYTVKAAVNGKMALGIADNFPRKGNRPNKVASSARTATRLDSARYHDAGDGRL